MIKPLIMAQLNTRIHLPTEPLSHYVTEVERLCRKLNMDMAEETKCSHILKVLSPLCSKNVCYNTSLAQPKDNLDICDLNTSMIRHWLGMEVGSAPSQTSHLEEQINRSNQLSNSCKWTKDMGTEKTTEDRTREEVAVGNEVTIGKTLIHRESMTILIEEDTLRKVEMAQIGENMAHQEETSLI